MQLDTERMSYADWYKWRDGKLDSLFAIPPTAINGLALVKPGEITTRWNYFNAVSRFFADAMLANQPVSTSARPDDTDTARLLERLSNHWAVSGECCILTINGIHRAIRPDYLWPVLNEYDREVVDRFLIVYPKVNERGGTEGEARVIEYHPAIGQAWDGIREWRAGWVANEPYGDPIQIDSLHWISTGDGFYDSISGIVREIIVRMNMMQVALNSVAVPLLQIDIDALDSGAFREGISLQRVAERGKTGLGITVQPPFEGESEAKYIERSGTGLREAMDYVRLLLSQLAVITGVPDYIFGVNLANPTRETERVLFAGQAKVNRFRREVERVFGELGLDITFPSEPFVTYGERQAATLRNLDAGIIHPSEAREALGLGDLPTSNFESLSGYVGKRQGRVGNGNPN